MPDEQTHVFKIFAQTKPGERVLMRSHRPGGIRPMSTLFLQQGTGTDSDWWVSEEVQLEVGRTVNYSYLIRSEDGVDTLEAQRRSLPVKRSETPVTIIADGAFKHKVQTSDSTVKKNESSGTPAGSAPVLAQEQVTTGKLSDPEPSLVPAGALEKCEQLEQHFASVKRSLLAEIKATFEEINGKLENMENRISANTDANAELERTQAELKREFVTTGRVDEISRKVESSLREIGERFEAVGLTLKDHTSRLADAEKEAGRGKEEAGALWEHLRQAGSSCQTEVAGVREEHGARIDALELALRQRVELAKSGVQDEVRALHEQQQRGQQEVKEEFRLLMEWQKANKDELKGSLEAMVERQRKTSQRAAELSQQVEDLEKERERCRGELKGAREEATALALQMRELEEGQRELKQKQPVSDAGLLGRLQAQLEQHKGHSAKEFKRLWGELRDVQDLMRHTTADPADTGAAAGTSGSVSAGMAMVLAPPQEAPVLGAGQRQPQRPPSSTAVPAAAAERRSATVPCPRTRNPQAAAPDRSPLTADEAPPASSFSFGGHPADEKSWRTTKAVEQEILASLSRGDDPAAKQRLVKRLHLKVHPDKGGTPGAFQWFEAWKLQHLQWFLGEGWAQWQREEKQQQQQEQGRAMSEHRSGSAGKWRDRA